MRLATSFATMFTILLIFFSFVPASATGNEALQTYNRMLSAWEPHEEEDMIDLCYISIFLFYLDKHENVPDALHKAVECSDIILQMQDKSGELARFEGKKNVNSKLITGLGAWALSVAYWYTGDKNYAEGAKKAADFLIGEMEKWEKTYPCECDDPRTLNQRNKGDNRSSLESYCWTSPNDLGLVGAGIGSLVYYGVARDPYYDHCLKMADALYDMQLLDGSWYDGYALKIPTRWDRSCHYVAMAMMGPWMAYKISANDKYLESLVDASLWLSGMQYQNGAVYDIWVDDFNLSKTPTQSTNKFDFVQVEGKTDVKEYFKEPYKTYLGEFSFLFGKSFLKNVGLDTPNLERTKEYLAGRLVFSNWYILSFVIEEREDVKSAEFVKTPSNAFLAMGKRSSFSKDNLDNFCFLSSFLIAIAIVVGVFVYKKRYVKKFGGRGERRNE
ncbi:MAG: hypothetical protein ACXQTP_00705 [Candidatus Methanofastidiosia archaeon]